VKSDHKNVLLFGNSIQEQILAKQLKKSPHLGNLYCVPNLPNIAAMQEYAQIIAVENASEFLNLMAQYAIDLAIPGGSFPGFSQCCSMLNIPVWEPPAAYKKFYQNRSAWRGLFRQQNIPTPLAYVFDNTDAVAHYLEVNNTFPIMAKNDSILKSKVSLCSNIEEIMEFLNTTIKNSLGDDTERVILEEHKPGRKFRILSLALEDTTVILPYCQTWETWPSNVDFNVGWISPSTFFNRKLYSNIERQIVLNIVAGFKNIEPRYYGFISIDLVVSKEMPYVVDVRLNLDMLDMLILMHSIEIDWLELLQGIIDRNVNVSAIHWIEQDALFVLLDSTKLANYPILPLCTGYFKVNGQEQSVDVLAATGNKIAIAYQTLSQQLQEAGVPQSDWINQVWDIVQTKPGKSSKYPKK